MSLEPTTEQIDAQRHSREGGNPVQNQHLVTETPPLDTLLNNNNNAQAQNTDTETLHAAFAAQQKEAWHNDVAGWRQATESDAELGGPHLGASVARAQRALQRFDPDRRIAQWLDQSGLGNHLEVLRFFNRLGKAFGDDTVATGRPAPAGLSLEERMYPNWNP